MENHKITTCRTCGHPSIGETYCSEKCNIINYGKQGAVKVKLMSLGEFVYVKDVLRKPVDFPIVKVLTEMKLDWHLRGEPFKNNS